jgi:hypothetical protein
VSEAHAHADTLLTYKRLAACVIQRAFKDVMTPACAAGDRRSARLFLGGSRMLFHWCSVADLDPRRVMATARTIGARPPSIAAPSEPPGKTTGVV